MRIAITGATGTLGAALARALRARGDPVVAFSRTPQTLRRLEGLAVEVFSYDIGGLRAALQAGTIDVLVHAACAYGRSGESPEAMAEANVFQPLRLIEAAGTDIGSCLAIGTGLPPDVSAYALTKAQFADRLEQLSAVAHAPRSLISLEHFYGSGDDPGKFLTRVARSCIAGQAVDLTAGTQERDFIHLSDVVRALICVIDLGERAWRVIPVGSGMAVPIRRVVEMIHSAAGSSSELRFGAVATRANEPQRCVADIQYLRMKGWATSVPLDEGIRDLVASEIKAMTST